MLSQQIMPDILALTVALCLGLIVLCWALRGRLRLGPPRCAKCGYDVRGTNWPANPDARCPECGAALTSAGAVSCACGQTRWTALVVGLVLLAAPWAVSFAVGLANQLRAAARPVSPRAAPAAVPFAAAPPRPARSAVSGLEGYRPWEPLLRQLAAGEIDSERANQLLEDAAKMLREPSRDSHAYRAVGAEAFASECHRRGIVAPDTLRRFLEAVFQWGGSLRVETEVLPADNWHDDQPISPFELRIQASPYWDGSGHKFKQVVGLRAIYAADGQKLSLWSPDDLHSKKEVSDLFSTTDYTGYLYVCHALPPGEHKLRMVFDVGAVPEDAHPRGLEGSWGVADKWPAPGKLWEFEHVCTVKIPSEGRVKIRIVGPAR